jgi:hypothetical protein
MAIDELDLEYFESALRDVERAGFTDLADRLRTFIANGSGEAVGTLQLPLADLPAVTDDDVRTWAWQAMYARPENLSHIPIIKPRDYFDVEILAGLRRVLEADRRRIARLIMQDAVPGSRGDTSPAGQLKEK